MFCQNNSNENYIHWDDFNPINGCYPDKSDINKTNVLDNHVCPLSLTLEILVLVLNISIFNTRRQTHYIKFNNNIVRLINDRTRYYYHTYKIQITYTYLSFSHVIISEIL